MSGIRSDIRDEADRLADAAMAAGLPLRLMGGLAVWSACPSARRPPYARDYRDIDLAAGSRDRRGVGAFLEGQGYLPEKLFNAIHGAQRLNFRHPDGSWTIDVLFDELRMSHRIDLRGRLEGARRTIDLADLLLTKLQIWEINDKDVGDAVCLLADHPLRQPGIDVGRIASVLGSDWGFCHTVERNLAKSAELARRQPPAGAPLDPVAQAAALVEAIDRAPKSIGWRSRARVGERVRWYETPEEVRR
ncbi:MAG: hypothetical protein ACJ761_09110 [Chloroflexota bacterium]